MASSARSGTDRPQPWARPFVTLLVAAFLTCGVLGIEAWPLSGFRLFSAPRSERSVGWRLVALEADGGSAPVNVSRLGAAYRGFGFIARTFDELSWGERAEFCAIWARAAASIGIDAVGFHVIRIEQRLIPRDVDGPLVEPRRTVTGACIVMRS